MPSNDAFAEPALLASDERPFSDRMTVLLAFLVIAGTAFLSTRESGLDWSFDHVGGTVRLAERTVELADAAEEVKGSRWSFVRLGMDSPDEARRHGIALYQKAVDRLETEERPGETRAFRAHLAFLLADAGRAAEAGRELAIVARSPEPCDFCDAMRALDSGSAAGASAVLARGALAPLRPGWSATQLEIRLLEVAGRSAEAAQLRAGAQRSAHARLLRVIAVEGLAAALLYVGVLSLAFEMRYQSWRPRVTAAPPLARWPWARGIGVFVRSEVAGLALTGLVAWRGCGGAMSIVCLWASLFWFLPILWLGRRYLSRGPWPEVRQDFRLLPAGLSRGETVRTALGLLTLIWIGGAAIEPVFQWLGLESDLSELYFDPMVMDTAPRMVLASLNAVLWAPLAEEITFRVLVYMSLRTIVRPGIAAFASAALFASAHLYSLPASLSVFWVGLVLAVGLERYRTLLPGLVCHVCLNLFFVISNVVSYR